MSGASNESGKELVDQADIIVFTTLATPLRLARLRVREKMRFGERIEKGRDMYQIHIDFMEWAKGYDDRSFKGRNVGMHERWLASRQNPFVGMTRNVNRTAPLQPLSTPLQEFRERRIFPAGGDRSHQVFLSGYGNIPAERPNGCQTSHSVSNHSNAAAFRASGASLAGTKREGRLL